MSKSPFKIIPGKKARPEGIEELFKELKNRSSKIKDLLSAQADVLREYQNHLKSRDVALELPTGLGKTLVGLLIAEYRRKLLGERTLYLCPTKQLAHQVGKHSKEYGLDARVFVGPKKYYNLQDLAHYRSARTIAISTYSGLFNTNPEFNDPQLIILDDAHSGETYIASMWSLVIERSEDESLYDDVFLLFVKDLPDDFVADLVQETKPGSSRVEKVPSGSFYRNIPELRQILDSRIPNPESDLYFPWTVVRKGLHACHVYISWDQILIRPYIPPTLTHQPFANANQRVYMSATLGSGGELERITGVEKISRIQTPKIYLSHGIGRRLFLFPDFANEPTQYESWIAQKVAASRRTLVLCPTNAQAKTVRKILNLWSPKTKVLEKSNIEESMNSFTDSEDVALVLANRYDGIDLPDEQCRQLLIYGLPSRTNLQEAFLEERLGLDVLLRERIKTRIAQGSGRCTRSDTDYAAVIMAGRSLLNFCTRSENQQIFHPELRAEISFALDQQVQELSELDSMLKAFFGRDENWKKAEQNIAERRAEEKLPDTSLSDIIAAAAENEVEFAYHLWSGDYEKAVESGRKVLDKLSGPRPIAPYAALWCYYVASVAYEQAKTKAQYKAIGDEFLERAREAVKTISWFAHALKSATGEAQPKTQESPLQALVVEGIIEVLSKYGTIGPKFQRKMEEVEKLVSSTKSKEFDMGLVELGTLLGFKSWKPEGEATPDCVWQLGSEMAFLLEGKVEESSLDTISVQNCRQASGHLNWAKKDPRLAKAKCFTVLVSPKSSISPDAMPHVDAVHLWRTPEVPMLFDKAKHMLTSVRAVMKTNRDQEGLRDVVLEKILAAGLTPEAMKENLLSQSLTDVTRDKANTKPEN